MITINPDYVTYFWDLEIHTKTIIKITIKMQHVIRTCSPKNTTVCDKRILCTLCNVFLLTNNLFLVQKNSNFHGYIEDTQAYIKYRCRLSLILTSPSSAHLISAYLMVNETKCFYFIRQV